MPITGNKSLEVGIINEFTEIQDDYFQVIFKTGFLFFKNTEKDYRINQVELNYNQKYE